MVGKTEEIVKTPLFLSHWDATVPIFIPVNVLEDLKNHHLLGIRFLYDCFRKDQKGAILNHENDMNFQIQISAFFTALNASITPKCPVLILSSEKFINAWHYHLTLHGGYDVTILSSKNCKEILLKETHRMILTTLDNTSLLREIKDVNFFSVVVDEFDLIATKAIIKQLKGQFNIGLTTRNFLNNPDQKLFWTILNWSNPGVLGKFADFCINQNHLINLRNPYRSWWQRLTWKFCDTFKVPTEEDQKKYKAQLQQWSKQHKITCLKTAPKRITRKSKQATALEIKTEAEPMEDVIEENHNIKKEILQNTENSLDYLYNKSPKRENISAENCNLLNNSFQDTKDILNLPNFSDENLCKTEIDQNDSQNLNSSQDTIIYEHQNSPSNNDENPILTSIVSSNSQLMLFDELKNEYDTDDDDDNILSSLIKN